MKLILLEANEGFGVGIFGITKETLQKVWVFDNFESDKFDI